jgi:hypothetical protein
LTTPIVIFLTFKPPQGFLKRCDRLCTVVVAVALQDEAAASEEVEVSSPGGYPFNAEESAITALLRF